MNTNTMVPKWERKEQMKKQYVTPLADKVEFDYEENVVASNAPSNPPITPPNDPCPCQGYGYDIIGLLIDIWKRLNPRNWW